MPGLLERALGASPSLRNVSMMQVILAVVTFIIIRYVTIIIYRVWFHPLSRFPGPKLSAASRIPGHVRAWNGALAPFIENSHRKYGDVVRIGPEEISIIKPMAWREVHGYGGNKEKNAKGSQPTKHWGRYGNALNGSYSLINARDDAHPRMRKIFNPAFSDRALKQQEPLFMKYADLLVQKLHERIGANPEEKIDIVRMYNFTTFDVMGDLTFGEPLHMLATGEYIPWVNIIFSGIRLSSRLSFLNNYLVLKAIIGILFGRSLRKKRMEHFNFAVDRVTRRLEKGSDSPDLWNLVLNKEEGKGLSRGEMDANSSLFMIAGTETTATLLSGLTYLLLKNPDKMKKLTNEIRSSFPSSQDMSMEALQRLTWLPACTEEALRLYPPVVTGMPRLTPPEGSTVGGDYFPGGTTLSIPHRTMYTSEKYFKDPNEFLPERWTGDKRFENDNRGVFQPFSFGPRNCLGKNMAYHEMRLIAAKVLYDFDLELCPESEGWLNQATYVIWEKRPLMVKLRPVQKA